MQNLFEFVETQKPFLFKLLDAKGFDKETLQSFHIDRIYNQFYYMWEAYTGGSIPEGFYDKRNEFVSEIKEWISTKEKAV
jgi:hypothetical protein